MPIHALIASLSFLGFYLTTNNAFCTLRQRCAGIRVDSRRREMRSAELKATKFASRFRIGATGVQGDMPGDVDPPEVVHTSRAL